MTAAYEQLIRHLDEHDLRYVTAEMPQSICAHFRGQAGSYRLIAWTNDQDKLFQIVGYLPVSVPEGGRSAVAETITRANYGLKVGKFEMDFNDGELRFHVAHIMGDEGLQDAIIHRSIATTILMLDRYMSAFLSVIYANDCPKEAVQRIERYGVTPGDRT